MACMNQGKNGNDFDFSTTNQTQEVDMQMLFEMIRSQRKDIDDSKRRERELMELLKEIRDSKVNKEIGVTITPNGQNYVPEVASQSQSVPNPLVPDWKEIALNLMTTRCTLIDITEKPTFNGSRKENPVHFLNKFENFWIDLNSLTINKLTMVISCLNDFADTWAMLLQKGWANFEDFKKDFLNFFWCELNQTYMMNKWLNLSFQEEDKLSMSEFFIRQFNNLSTITIIQSEAAMLDSVMRQFPDHVRSLWGIMAEKTVKSALLLLKREEYNQESRLAKRMRDSPDSQRGISGGKESRKRPRDDNEVISGINRALVIMDNEQEEREKWNRLEYVSRAN